jgi:hypothetical protein
MPELVALVLSLATLFLQQPASTQAADAVSWPIPGVERPGDGVTSPILIHETKPNHIWSFVATLNGQLVDVFCTVLHRANATDHEKAEDVRRGGLEFGAILRRSAVRPK